jgi:hypothetical protein
MTNPFSVSHNANYSGNVRPDDLGHVSTLWDTVSGLVTPAHMAIKGAERSEVTRGGIT